MIEEPQDSQRVAREELSKYLGERVREVMDCGPEKIRVVVVAAKIGARIPGVSSTINRFISDVRAGDANYAIGFDRTSNDTMRKRNLDCLAVLFEMLGFQDSDKQLQERDRIILVLFIRQPE
jgi:hypothetical protein